MPPNSVQPLRDPYRVGLTAFVDNLVEQYSDGSRDYLFVLNRQSVPEVEALIVLSAVPTVAKFTLSNTDLVMRDLELVEASSPVANCLWQDLPGGLVTRYEVPRGTRAVLLHYTGWANITQV
jgi:hypothetical protein